MSSANSPRPVVKLVAILATHEISFARKVADWVVLPAAGKVQICAASDFFTKPQTQLAQQYLEGLSKYR